MIPGDGDEGEIVNDDVPWNPWTPEEIASLLTGMRAPWYVVGGWALDLFRGQQTRSHDDTEIGVPAESFAEIRSILGQYEFDVVGSGRRWPLASEAFVAHFQTWVREPETGVYHLDIFRDPHNGSEWICRRDPRIRMPYDQLICISQEGIPYMSPEVVLLFKAKEVREKDRIDFEGALPLLSQEQIDWLRVNLELLHHGHSWLKELGVD